jgi:hypothetical protein
VIIGLPREIKDGERRVALVPDAVAALVAAGHVVRVERGAGAGAGFVDAAYAERGATLVDSASRAFDADLVVKVKEIQTDEWRLLNPGGMLFCFLHLGADPFMAHELLSRRITGLAFETVEDDSRRLAILAPMSVIAGELSIPIAACLLMTANGGRGVAISDARWCTGAGSAGAAAAPPSLWVPTSPSFPATGRLAALRTGLAPAPAPWRWQAYCRRVLPHRRRGGRRGQRPRRCDAKAADACRHRRHDCRRRSRRRVDGDLH